MKTKTFNFYLSSFPLAARRAAFSYWKQENRQLNFFGFAVEYRNQFGV